ncbi:MAG: peptidoglycan DD-metalloendopeptidase family protein [Clostridia bacterium]|nr:peptidoglycan DD-metalloendopeptidase family protein [Clostridia bacterium]
MPKSNKNIFLKLKEDKGARAIAITVTVMLLVLTAIIITTVIANRAVKNDLPMDDIGSEPAGVTDPDENQQQPDTPVDPNPAPTPDQNPPTTDQTDANALPKRFLLPVAGVLQEKHNADMQVFSDTMGDYRVHLGIDIGTIEGASVCAMADGVIAQVWEDVSMGQCVAISHSGNSYTIYKNLAVTLPDSVKVGAAVKAGDVIGTIGESAMVEIAEQPHLHLEMTVNGLLVNPTDYLDADAMATLGEDANYEDVS